MATALGELARGAEVTGGRIVVLLVGLVGPLAGYQQSVFRVGTDAVLVDVSVRDGERSVSGLSREDFELRDNAMPQRILDVTAEVIPLDVTVLVDASESSRTLFGESLARAGDRIRGLFGPNDHVEVRDFGAKILDAADWHGEPLGGWATGSIYGDRGTALFDALAMTALRPTSVGFRRLVIVLTDGRDTVSFLNHRTLLAVVQRADIVVDVVAAALVSVGTHSQLTTDNPTNLPRPAETLVTVRDYSVPLKRISSTSGGYYFDLNENSRFIDGLALTVSEFRARYVLRYSPSSLASGWHTIAVSVPGHKYQIVARQGYSR